MGRFVCGAIAIGYGMGSFVVLGFWFMSWIDRGLFDDHTLILFALNLAMWNYAADKARHLGWERE